MKLITSDLGFGNQSFLRSTVAPAYSAPAHKPYQHHNSRFEERADSGIAGFAVPWLVDLLSDPRYAEEGRLRGIGKFLAGWQQNIAALWREQNAAFALRLSWDPQQGSVEVSALVRTTAPETSFLKDMTHTAGVFQSILSANRLPTIPIVGEHLEAICHPPWVNGAVEVRQREQIFTMRLPHRQVQAYAILPFAQAVGDWVDILAAMTLSKEPLLLNLCIQPTELTDVERESISSASIMAKRLIDFQFQGRSEAYKYQNPQAETVSRIYGTLEKRLVQPFLAVAHVFAPSQTAAEALGNRVGEAIIGHSSSTIEEQVGELPVGFEAITLDQRSFSAAYTSLSHMLLEPCASSLATPGKERLRYLVDARGAAALFRLPLATESGLPGIEVRKPQMGQEIGKRISVTPKDHLQIGTQADGSIVSIPVRELPRHGLICGIPGSGKTNTTLSLLSQLWRDHKVPFWLFEPPKTEYRGLLQQSGFEELLIFTVGDESVAPFRINPFELQPGVSVEQHIANLRICFEAALPKIDESGQLLGMYLREAMTNAYKARRWRSSDVDDGKKSFPTLHSLLPFISDALRDYKGENRQNLEAAIVNRVRLLLRGSKGRMFNVERGFSISDLMRRPVIFELLPMGSDTPLILMFLLTFLQEYAARREVKHLLGVEHVTIIEEAHVIMARADGSKGTGATGVSDAFDRILSELRSSGEGVLIAEQSPTKLLKSAIDLTNLKIVHRLAGSEEVAAVGASMIATESQKASFQRLSVGEAAIFMQGMQGPTFLRAPNYKEEVGFAERLHNTQVENFMKPFYARDPHSKLPFYGCSHCQSICSYKNDIEKSLEAFDKATVSIREVTSLLLSSDERLSNPKHQKDGGKVLCRELSKISAIGGHKGILDASWCAWTQIVDEDLVFERGARLLFESSFAENLMEEENRHD